MSNYLIEQVIAAQGEVLHKKLVAREEEETVEEQTRTVSYTYSKGYTCDLSKTPGDHGYQDSVK